MLEIPVRPKTVNSFCIGDKLAQKRIYAFNIAHREEIKKRTKQEEQSWKEDERFRMWRAKKTKENSFGVRKATHGNSDRDRGVLEKVILERNDYYSLREGIRTDQSDEVEGEEFSETRSMRPSSVSISRKFDSSTTFKN